MLASRKQSFPSTSNPNAAKGLRQENQRTPRPNSLTTRLSWNSYTFNLADMTKMVRKADIARGWCKLDHAV